ncbi:MAG: ABC transporter ATP-binding protein [Spirobacillus cienkowskii]|jgi:iron(III) transport system ATP-binding protein|uniref:ABC transporter ATP-binding protein n=1 Tax=Spirobacillus cienkowskii TaxID=495820 RepID=A0A369KYH2_9BACT|nr:MAG: ABC transporter ATP-binding protein [Spirobacillus cienkowskii]
MNSNLANIFFSCNNVYLNKGKKTLLKNINFQISISDGEFISLVGPSGSGKTTLLKAITGIEKISDGVISLSSNVISSSKIHLPIEQRNIGLVFQDLALFPHLNVAENIKYGLCKKNKTEVSARLNELLKLVQLNEQSEFYPHMLSGGQQQRVAFARSLAPKPKLLLLDEPFSGLDFSFRREIALKLKNIIKNQKTTSIYVTHQPEEALYLSDKIILMNNGEIVQIGTPQDIYLNPNNLFALQFFSQVNSMNAVCIDNNKCMTEFGKVNFNQNIVNKNEKEIKIHFRSDALIFSNNKIDENSEKTQSLPFKIEEIRFHGQFSIYRLSHPKISEIFSVQHFCTSFKIGDIVHVSLKKDFLYVF